MTKVTRHAFWRVSLLTGATVGLTLLTAAQQATAAQPTIDEVLAIVNEIKEENRELRRENSELRDRLDTVESQVSGNVVHTDDWGDLETLAFGDAELRDTQSFPGINNPGISAVLDGDFRARDEGESGEVFDRFNLRAIEIAFAANVDQHLHAFIQVAEEEGEFGVEEAYGTTLSLPHGFQIRAGQMFANLGRFNSYHTHDLPFFEQPFAMKQVLGPIELADGELEIEGNFLMTGIEKYWTAPVPEPWFLRFSLGIANGFSDRSDEGLIADLTGNSSDPAKRTGDDFVWMPGVTVARAMGDYSVRAQSHVVLDRPGGSFDRNLWINTLTFLWEPPGAGDRRAEWTTEVYFNDEQFGPGTAAVESHGVWSMVNYQFRRDWETGVLGEWGESRFNDAAEFWGIYAWITKYFSENHRLRLQLDYTDRQEVFDDFETRSMVAGLSAEDQKVMRVILQWTWLIGTHGHAFR